MYTAYNKRVNSYIQQCRFNFKVSRKLMRWWSCRPIAAHMPSIGNHRSCFVIMDLTPLDLTQFGIEMSKIFDLGERGVRPMDRVEIVFAKYLPKFFLLWSCRTMTSSFKVMPYMEVWTQTVQDSTSTTVPGATRNTGYVTGIQRWFHVFQVILPLISYCMMFTADLFAEYALYILFIYPELEWQELFIYDVNVTDLFEALTTDCVIISNSVLPFSHDWYQGQWLMNNRLRSDYLFFKRQHFKRQHSCRRAPNRRQRLPPVQTPFHLQVHRLSFSHSWLSVSSPLLWLSFSGDVFKETVVGG